MNTTLHFASRTDVTGTPWPFFRALAQEFPFVCDMAATADNAKLPCYVGPDAPDPRLRDCLTLDWPTTGPVWLNPPYSRAYPFVAKAAEQRTRGVTTVCLLAARTDTRWFHDHIWDVHRHQPYAGCEVRFIPRRLTFQGHTASAPFPSMVVIFRGRDAE